MNILVIDDDRLVRRALGRLLMGAHSVSLAQGGSEGLDLVRGGGIYDAILCDFQMPELNGRAFYAELRALSPTLADRVIFMTGGTSGADDDAFLKSHRALIKPFELPALDEALGLLDAARSALGSGRP